MFEWVKSIVNKMVGWVDRIFQNFEGYSSGYSELLVYGLLIYLVGKMLKIKLNVNTGTSKK
jgi:hypothetical protein